MTTTIGVIGTGNMGSALVKGWLRAEDPDLRLLVWDKVESAAQRLLTGEAVSMPPSLDGLVREADLLVVVVKPKDAAEVLAAIRPFLRREQSVISSMAGVELSRIRSLVGPGPGLFRIMPNLGVGLGAGAIAVAEEPGGPADGLQTVVATLSALGQTMVVPESMLDAVTAVAGTGPALLAVALEGLEDGAVAAGLTRPVARRLVRRMALETARLLPAHDDSAARLREDVFGYDHVAGPAIERLEARGVRAAYRRAVEAAMRRSLELRAQAGTAAPAPPAPCTLEEKTESGSQEG
jgi:pyrroline-5-carboxylate reductase